MTRHAARASQCTTYRGTGQSTCTEEAFEAVPLTRHRTIADSVPLRQIMSRELICARPDLDIRTVVQLMIRHHVGCIPVVDDRRHPIGMITKFDVVEQLDASLRAVGEGAPLPQDLQARTADEVMMPLALALPEHATIAHAATMMASEDTHHVLVISTTGALVGVLSTRDIVTWLVDNDGLLA